MARKLSLPTLEDRLRGNPTLQQARRRLGGRGSTSARAGGVVVTGGARGVVLYADDTECDVLLESGLVKRTALDRVTTTSGAPAALEEAAVAVRVFARLAEGERVRFEQLEAAAAEGRLIEKCRYGALIARDDGSIVAVGFRRIWPLSPAATS